MHDECLSDDEELELFNTYQNLIERRESLVSFARSVKDAEECNASHEAIEAAQINAIKAKSLVDVLALSPSINDISADDLCNVLSLVSDQLDSIDGLLYRAKTETRRA